MQRNDRERLDEGESASVPHVADADRLVWQRLVDNRLSDEEYRQLLLDLETKPGLWRACAMAFLEDQALKQALAVWRSADAASHAAMGGPDRPVPARLSATGPSATGPSATGPSATGPSATGPSATGPSATGLGTAERVAGSTHPSSEWAVAGASGPGSIRGKWFQPLVVSVSLAAGFLLATFALSSRSSGSGDPATNAQVGSAVPAGAVPVGEPLVMDRESFKDFLADLRPDQRQELFQRPTQQRVSPTVAARPASLVPGQVEAERRFLFYRTADGGMIVVPVDDYRFVAQEFQ